MARKYIAIEDLTAEGLREDEASTKKLWKTLENVRRGNGGWQKRPGINRIDDGALPAVTIGVPKQIITYKHPDNRGQSEIIRPNATGNYNQWTTQGGGDNFVEIDEVTADDDTSFVEEATLGESTSFGFENLALTWNAIASIRLTIRARRVASINHTLLVKVRISGVDHDFGSGSVVVSSGTGWLNLEIDSSINPATSLPWTPTEVDALEIILEKGAGTDNVTETLALVPSPGAVARYAAASVPTANTWVGTPTTTILVTYTHTGTATLVLQDDVGTVVADLNASPATHSTPWIRLVGTGLAFRISDSRRRRDLTVSAADIIRTGQITDDNQTLRVTQVLAVVEGDGATGDRNSLLFVTADAFLRVAEDLSTYTDVVGTATAPTASAGAVWDNAVFLDRLYVTNGKDQMFTYPTGANVFNSLSGFPVGATLVAFNSRLCLGDVIESGIRTPARFRWSAINDAENYTDASSGNLELDETPGKIVKLKPIVEPSDALVGVLAAYKTQGIYHLSATGSSSEPFQRKLMDSSTGCIARGSVVGISTQEGREAHVFLGQVGGTLNVMSWNGREIQQFGFEIVPILNDIGDTVNLEKSIAVIDTFGNYVLMFPTANSSFLKSALVYNFNKKLWSTWTLGNVTALGTWVPNTGAPITVLGRPDSFAYRLDDSIVADDTEGQDAAAYTATLETGDLALLAPEIWKDGVLERVWLFYKEDSSETVVTLDATADGGANRSIDEDTTSVQAVLTGGTALQLNRFDLRVPGRKHGFRIRSTLADGKPQFLQMIFEIEEGGVETP